MIGRRIRFGFSIISAIASFFDFGSGRSLNTGLRVLTKSRKCSGVDVLLEELARRRLLVDVDLVTSTPAVSRKLLAFLQVVQVGFV